MLNSDKLWRFCRWLLFFAALQSFGAWFFVIIPPTISYFVTFLVCSLLIFGKKRTEGYCIPWLIIYFIAFILTIITRKIPNVFGIVEIFIKLYSIGFVFLLKPEYKHDLLQVFKKGLFVLCGVSLPFWILHLSGVGLPHSSFVYGVMNDNQFQYYFDNYYFFVTVSQKSLYDSIFPRFQCVFIEPGYLGCLLSALLYSGRYQLKKNKENIVYLISLILTLSLAGWILTFLGVVLTSIKKSKGRTIWLFAILLIFVGLYIFAVNYKGGDNDINLYIFSRLQYDESRGITGNARVSESLSDYFWSTFIHSNPLWFGGIQASDHTGFMQESNEVTAYTYIMQYGLVAFVFLLWYYLFPVFKNKKNRYSLFSLSIIFILVFAQTIHMTHSFMYVFLFIMCVNEIIYYQSDNDIDQLDNNLNNL